jgi:hypothetical protein
MNNDLNTAGQGESIDDCELHRSERNRYFHGKLMSARDMQAEQRYNRGLFTRHASQVTGQGVVSGLEISLEEADDADDAFAVELQPGYAVDCCGRPVVVPNETTVTVEPNDDLDGGPAWVSLAYEECVRETVPVPNSEDACEQECEYNRILEVFDIRVELPDPDRSPSKPVPPIEFPSKDDVEDDETAALDRISREYESQDVPVGCQDGEGHTVFLGQYTKRGGDWERDDREQARSRVYTNDMLYAGLTRHTADFGNPHQVSLRTEAESGGALLGNEDDETDQPDVTLSSSDDTLTIDVSEADQRIDLKMGEAIDRLIQHRLDPVEAYVVDRVFKYTHRTFTRYLAAPEDDFRPYTYGNMTESLAEQIADRDEGDLVQKILDATKGVLAQASPAEHLRENPDELVGIQSDQASLVEEIEDLVTASSYDRLEDASDALETAVDGIEAGDGTTMADVAAAQNALCQAVVLLEPDQVDEASASFSDSVYRVERGDPVEFTVEVDGGPDTVEVVVGDEAEMGYETLLEVEPGGAEQFTITMNTFLAGNASNEAFDLGYDRSPDNETSGGVWAIDSPDDEASIRRADFRTDELNTVIDAGDYELTVQIGESEEGVAVILVDERATVEHTVWTAPHAEELVDTPGGAEIDAEAFVEDHEMTDSRTVAVADGEREQEPRGDWVVHEVDVTGVFGAIAAFGVETLADLFQLEEDIGVRALAFDYEQTDPPANQEPFVLHESNDSLETFPVYVDADAGSLFVVLDSSDIAVARDRDQSEPQLIRDVLESPDYDVTFTVEPAYRALFTDEPVDELEPEVVNDTVRFADRTAEFETETETIVVEASEGQTIAGQTSIAPGTNVDIRVRGTDGQPFLQTTETVVEQDRIFSGEFDFSDHEPGIGFVASVPGQSVEDDARTRGRIEE